MQLAACFLPGYPPTPAVHLHGAGCSHWCKTCTRDDATTLNCVAAVRADGTHASGVAIKLHGGSMVAGSSLKQATDLWRHRRLDVDGVATSDLWRHRRLDVGGVATSDL